MNAKEARKLTDENHKSINTILQKIYKDIERKAKEGKDTLENPFSVYELTTEGIEKIIKELKENGYSYHKSSYNYSDDTQYPDYFSW